MSEAAVEAAVDANARPEWKRTGYAFFPHAARHAERWWVLRLNFGFPEHDLYTVFVDGQAAVDVTGDPNAGLPLAASIGALGPTSADGPVLDAGAARAVVSGVAPFADYGSEHGQPCVFCARDRDGLTPDA